MQETCKPGIFMIYKYSAVSPRIRPISIFTKYILFKDIFCTQHPPPGLPGTPSFTLYSLFTISFYAYMQ